MMLFESMFVLKQGEIGNQVLLLLTAKLLDRQKKQQTLVTTAEKRPREQNVISWSMSWAYCYLLSVRIAYTP